MNKSKRSYSFLNINYINFVAFEAGIVRRDKTTIITAPIIIETKSVMAKSSGNFALP